MSRLIGRLPARQGILYRELRVDVRSEALWTMVSYDYPLYKVKYKVYSNELVVNTSDFCMNYTTLATSSSQENAAQALTKRRFKPMLVESGEKALEVIKSLIPEGASVMNGSSVTLESIGFVDHLKSGQHGWNNLHEVILKENDPAKRSELRTRSVVSDFYLGSVSALSETGEMVVGSNTGSQMPHLVYTSPNLILVVGAQKITSTLHEALDRLEKHVIPLEDEHMKQLYGAGTAHNKTVILHGESAMMKRSVTVLIVNEKLGF